MGDEVNNKTATYTAQLFLGFTIDSIHAQKLKKVDPALLTAYVQEGDLYLQELSYSGERFFGKYIPGSIDLPHLEQLQTNIQSILHKLFPEESTLEQALVLLAVPSNE